MNYPDHYGIAAQEAELTRELAELQFAVGKPAEAAELFRRALQQKRQTFKSRAKPVQWSLAFSGRGDFRDQEYEQPERFCEYAQMQLRLSTVLQQLKRMHEAELMLGEVVTICDILTRLHPDNMQLAVAQANSFAQVAELLADKRPREAGLAVERARWLWQRALQQWPRVREYRSGVRGPERDFDWFMENFPSKTAAAAGKGQEPSGLRGDTIFWHHTKGVMFLEGNWYPDAIGNLRRSAELRPDDAAFDWLYLAWACFKNGETQTAREWFEKADRWIRKQPQQDVELDELRGQVAQMMDGELP
jgi:tetratricopeptide (TPR) repeat protein